MATLTLSKVRRSFATASVLAAAAAFALAGCSSAVDGSGPSEAAAGTWTATSAGDPMLQLTDDGRYSGTDGCNQVSGEWEQTGAEVTFTAGVTTLMACEGIPGWPGLSTGHISGTAMTLKDEAGAELGVLTRE